MKEEDMASPLTGPGHRPDGSSQQAVSTLRASVPDVVWVIVRSTGEYSDRIETPIIFCLSEDDAKRAIIQIGVERQRDKPPALRRKSSYGFLLNGEWLPENLSFSDDRRRHAKFTKLPDAEEIERQNAIWGDEYKAAITALGHVDPEGSWRGAEYYYERVTLWPAIAIEARQGGNGEAGAVEDESAGPQDIAAPNPNSIPSPPR